MPHIILAPFLLLLSTAFVNGDGLYTKSSPVIQVDATNYDRLIGRSNYTSIVEFYAPWCGHCKNLKPAYEKAATSLAGIAKVAAVNCDEESNKPFCGAMGVQGFPTLKIVKPVKNPAGKNTVEDYNGARTAKAINEAVADKIPNHVQRLKDKDLDKWLDTNPDRPKTIFFSQKGLVPAMVKALAIDFKGGIDFGFARDGDKSAVQKYGIDKFPTVLLIPTGDAEPVKHKGEVKKDALLKFFSSIMPPHPDSVPAPEKKAKTPTKPKEKPSAASETLDEASQPTESPGPNAAPDEPKPIQLPTTPPAKVVELETEDALQKSCLHTKSGTCILAVSSAGTGSETVTKSLAEIATHHKNRGTKIFPFYSVPSTNTAGKTLVDSLPAAKEATAETTILAINAKKSWWSLYTGSEHTTIAIESWIDDIRMGDAKKEKLPIELIKDLEENLSEPPTPPEGEKVEDAPHVEL